MIFLIALAVIYIWKVEGDRKWIKSFFSNRQFWGLALIFFVYLCSGINSSDVSEWIWRARTKLPFLLLPFAFFALPHWSNKVDQYVRLFFITLASISLIIVLSQYFLSATDVVNQLKYGKSFETPVNHIRFSIILAIASIFALDSIGAKKHPWIYSISFIILMAGLHILAIRSGLLLFYLGTITLLGLKLWKAKKYLILVLCFVSIISLPFIAYYTVDSFKQKIDYMHYDWNKLEQNDGHNYSDVQRIMSWKAGWHLFAQNPIMGTGIGDLKGEMKKYYAEVYDLEKPKFPHNQYLFVLAGSGTVGFFIFIIGLLSPMKRRDSYKRPIFISIYLMLITSCLVENTLETSVGVGIFIFFTGYFMSHKKN